MFFCNRRYVENQPTDVGFQFSTGDETRAEAASAATLAFVLRKVFTSPAMWMIALSSMCIGMVRNSIDHWDAKYVCTVFHLKAAELRHFGPWKLASIGTPFAAVLGGLAAGNASDSLFQSRRAPVIFFAFLGQALSLFWLSRVYDSAWAGCFMLFVTAFFIQAAHSLVGGAASMDFGGKKAVATAAGLFDGAQYLAGAIVGWGMGSFIDRYKGPIATGSEYRVWPLAPLPFALIGALLISRLWNVVPGRKAH
jgi:OPA family glycerol-3-phosphate transporter-like MFS transporter